MKDLRNIIADNNKAVEKASHPDKDDTGNNLVGRLVQVDQSLDEYAGMIGRVLAVEPYLDEDTNEQVIEYYKDTDPVEAVVDFTNSPFVNPEVDGEYLGEVYEQTMDLFPLDEL